MPTAAGNIKAANAPWATRKTIIHVSAMPVVGVKPQNADATAKPMTPMTTIRRRPRTSPSLPPNANSADNDSR